MRNNTAEVDGERLSRDLSILQFAGSFVILFKSRYLSLFSWLEKKTTKRIFFLFKSIDTIVAVGDILLRDYRRSRPCSLCVWMCKRARIFTRNDDGVMWYTLITDLLPLWQRQQQQKNNNWKEIWGGRSKRNHHDPDSGFFFLLLVIVVQSTMTNLKTNKKKLTNNKKKIQAEREKMIMVIATRTAHVVHFIPFHWASHTLDSCP